MADMAKTTVLKKFDFPAPGASGFGEAKYDWDTLLNGKIHRLDRGVHYDFKGKNGFWMAAKHKAGLRGQSVNLAWMDGGAYIVIQAVGDIDLEAGAVYKAEAKAKAKAAAERSAAKKAEANGDTETTEEAE